MLPKPLATLSLAAKVGISPGKYATAEQLSELRSAARTFTPQPSPALPPTEAKKKAAKRLLAKRTTAQSTAWIVHGRNYRVRDALVNILGSLGLKVLDFKTAIMKTKQGAPYVGTILSTAFNVANFVVVLLTPDDDVKLRKRLWRKNEPAYERRLMGQARPNVLFEAGQAFGIHPGRTILVQVGEMKPHFSDVQGRHICMLSNDSESREDLVKKLRGIGAAVDAGNLKYLKAFDALDW